MANSSRINGFTLTDSVVTQSPVSVQAYPVDASNATAIFRNDPIMQESDGYFAAATNGIGIACAAVCCGAFDSNGIALSYLPALTAGTIIGIPVKGHVFEVQADTGTTLDQGCVGATADFVSGSGSTVSGISGYQLDSSNVGTGNQLRIMGLVGTPNNVWGDVSKLRVMFVENLYESNTSV